MRAARKYGWLDASDFRGVQFPIVVVLRLVDRGSRIGLSLSLRIDPSSIEHNSACC